MMLQMLDLSLLDLLPENINMRRLNRHNRLMWTATENIEKNGRTHREYIVHRRDRESKTSISKLYQHSMYTLRLSALFIQVLLELTQVLCTLMLTRASDTNNEVITT